MSHGKLFRGYMFIFKNLRTGTDGQGKRQTPKNAIPLHLCRLDTKVLRYNSMFCI